MGFFDLNIPYESSQSSKTIRLKLVVKAMELGYTGIAYNHTIKGVMSDRDRCSIAPLSLSSLLKFAPSLASSVNFHRDLVGVPRASPFRQYTRLTVCVDNPAKSQALNSGNSVLKSYDMVAVRPLNQVAFDHACEKAEVDIIAVDFSEKVPFRLKQPMVKAAIKRGVYFEITYSDLIVDVQVRRQMISTAKMLVDWTRGRNIILSSGAPSVSELRGPCDVANLSSLLGLSNERAKAAISKNCRNLIAIALRKKHFYKDTIRVEPMPSSGKSDPKSPLSLDWLKWDPISSGQGDLQLDDMAKSFSATDGISSSVKAIDFTSVIDSISSHNGSLLSAWKTVDVPVATTELTRHNFPDSDENSSSKNQLLDFRSSQTANFPGNTAKSGNVWDFGAPAVITTEEPKSTAFPDIQFPPIGTQNPDLLSQGNFPSSEIDAILPNEDTICQESVMDIEIAAPFDNKVENVPKDLTCHDKQIENTRDSLDLDAQDQETLVTEIVPTGEIKKLVEDARTLVDHLPNANLETLDEAVLTENEYRVVNHETQEEATMEKQKRENFNEKTVEELVIDDHRDVDSEIVLGVDNKLEIEDDSLNENFISSMEVELKEPKHEDADSQSNIPRLLLSLPEKSKAKGRAIFQPLKFPLSRMLNPTPFKRKSRKSKHKRV